jgi:FkbH-like protein
MDLLRLPWLPSPPADFRGQCGGLKTAEAPGGEARALAGHALDINQLWSLARAWGQAVKAGRDPRPLRPFKLGLLSNATTDYLVQAIVASGLRHGLAVDVVAADYGQALQAAADPKSTISRAKPDAVLAALDYRGLGLAAAPGGDESGIVEAALSRLDAIRAGVHAHCDCPVLIQTLAAPTESLFGSFDRRLSGTLRRLCDRFNSALPDRLSGSADVVLDVAHIAETVGLATWWDHGQWHLAKQPCALDALPLLADHIARLLAALRGLSRKCLVLDLDNTLWGGVIGDDGLAGIRIGQGDAVGEAFLAVQQMALDLRARGIVLAVCSKNDEAKAREPFRDHPDMLLRDDHIAVFQANWTDKAANLRAIAKALNIGTDALVFLDDNPAERALVRRELPEVAVPELPADPSLYPRTLLAAGWFEAIAFSEEDSLRADQYRANAQRAVLEASVTDVEGYLRSLAMVAKMGPFDPVGRSRIAQLINKSNQFNLTTRRYTEAGIARLETDNQAFTLQVRLADVLGDNGMISVVIARPNGTPASWEIDTWLMSCRVLGRRVENAVLNVVVSAARARNIDTLIGRYVPSGRNDMVVNFYRDLGFAAAGSDGDATLWRLDLAAYRPAEVPIVIEAA